MLIIVVSDMARWLLWGGGGVYRKIVKVKIEGDECLSSNIAWAQKTPKTIDPRATQILANAKAFILENVHFGFLKFWLITSVTNEDNTLWWTKGTLREMYIQDRAHQPTDNVMLMGPTKWQWWDQVERFRKKRVKLSWALVWLMLELHKGNVQDNNLSICFVGSLTEAWGLKCAIGGGVAHEWECCIIMACGNWRG